MTASVIGVVFGLIALGLTAFGAWLLEGWVNTGSFWILALLFICGMLFVGFGFVALILFAILVGALVGFIGSSQ